MLQNQRAYQYVESRTGCRALAAFVAWSARWLGRGAAVAAKWVCRQTIPEQRLEELAQEMPQLYPKPLCAEGEPQPLLPQDESVDLSIIVPVHNGEKFLRPCLDSILQQETRRSIQLIAVEDHSTDASVAILEEYQQQGRVTVLHPVTGGSAAAARNTGLAAAVGHWILFVDCDDLLLPGAVETLAAEMERTGADIVQGGWQYLYTDGSYGAAQRYQLHCYENETRRDMLDLPGMPWGKLYRRELFERVRFPEGYPCFEDAIIHFLVFPQAKRVAAVREVVYAWRKNPAGLTSTSQHSPRAVLSYWIAEEMAAQAVRLGLQEEELFPCNLILQLANYCYACISGLSQPQREQVFACCCRFYSQWETKLSGGALPFSVRLAQDALAHRNMRLWELEGKLYQLTN